MPGDAYADHDRFYDTASSVDDTSDTWDAGVLRGNLVTAGFTTDMSIQKLRSKGVPANKVVLGVGFRGRPGWRPLVELRHPGDDPRQDPIGRWSEHGWCLLSALR